MPKFICIDVDDILVTETQETPASAREAVRASIAVGDKLLFSTGRSLPGIYPFLRDLGFHGIIAGSRVYMKIGEEIVMDRRMSVEEASYVIDVYRRHGVNWMWQGPDEFCMSEGFLGSFAGAPNAEGSPWYPCYLQILPVLSTKTPTSTSKGLFVLLYDSSVNYEEFVETIGPKYHIIPDSVGAAEGTTGELLLAGLTKDVGMRAAAKHLGFDMADTVAIDDSPNDIEILRAVGTSMAVGNATDAVKSHADLVTPAIDDDGMYRAFETLGLM